LDAVACSTLEGKVCDDSKRLSVPTPRIATWAGWGMQNWNSSGVPRGKKAVTLYVYQDGKKFVVLEKKKGV